jgi:hypothetical protein
VTPRLLELLVWPVCKGDLGLRAGGPASGDVRYQLKHRYSQVLRWFRKAGFGDLYVADKPICVRGLKVFAP